MYFLVNILRSPDNTSMKRRRIAISGLTATATLDLPVVSKYILAVEPLNL